MGRWSQYDTDEERLPEGMKRIGYDADTQVYSFRDADGSMWESAPGNQYGQLHRVSGSAPPPPPPPPYDEASGEPPGRPASWRHDMMPLLNWFLLVGLFLLLVFWFISSAAMPPAPPACGEHSTPHHIRPGDSCWAIADDHGIPLDALLRENAGVDCDKLAVGGTICVPQA
ncbi:carbohydrate-binding module family 50 protein [Durotheca rogersii]|uniref:carbohydrate-binding module family 50 protein n=1 Tax=Durotheca rogersii TaxID=419775 RepID=UPI0022211F7F|nr:carbohydrate-binding module family 50 protein [Durotheca rogersii]KAI5855083.1 carbohydrate-binding module family 50 protein [Durotheca rogersii]